MASCPRVLYTYEDVAKHNTQNDCWVVITDKVYNLTEFMHGSHSGGFAPLSMAGTDATVAFAMIHPTSAFHFLEDSTFMSKYCVGYIKEPKFKGLDDPHFTTYIKLKKEAEQHLDSIGWKQRDNLVDYTKTWVLLACFVVVYVLFLKLGSIPFAAFTGLMSFPLVGSHMHTAAHGGITKSPHLSALFANICGAIYGISPWVWRNKHTLHHVYTMEQEDDDIQDKGPITMNPCDERKSYHAYQHLYFIFVYPLLHLSYIFNHMGKLMTQPNYALSERLAFVVSISLFFILFIYLPVQLHGMKRGLMMFLVYSFVASLAMCLVVVSGHMVPTSKYWGKSKDDLLTRQVLGTNNFCSRPGLRGAWVNTFLEGLGNQLEHHFFPSFSPHTYHELSKVVQRFLREHNLPYFQNNDGVSCGLVTSIANHQQMLSDLGKGKIMCPMSK